MWRCRGTPGVRIDLPPSWASANCLVSVAARFKQKPRAPLGFINLAFDQTCGGDVASLVHHVVQRAQARRQFLIVLAQLSQHVEGFNVVRIIVLDALDAGDVADGAQREAADLADALRDRIANEVWAAYSNMQTGCL